MTDPIVLGVLAGAGYVTMDTVKRVLGPTADYIGDELKLSIQRRRVAGRIVQNAAEKAGDRLNEPGAVPPRVLRDVVNDGSFNEDEISVEYFGGVLASSRTPNGRDDRGAVLTNLLSRLSTYQMRSHYILYSAMRQVHLGSEKNIGDVHARRALGILLPFRVYLRLMDFSAGELVQRVSIAEHVMFGLDRESLIGRFQYGQWYKIRTSADQVCRSETFQGIEFQPTVIGAELFLSAHGLGNKGINAIFDPNLTFKPLDGIVLGPDDAYPTSAVVRQKDQ